MRTLFLVGKKMLVHYIGDHSSATDFPHEGDQAHSRTCPSVLRSLPLHDVPSNVYRSEIDCQPQHQPVLKPRNTKQISNMQAWERQKFRLTHDALFNLHDLADDLDGFIAKITTYPDLIVICGLNVIVTELDKVLQASTHTPHSSLVTSLLFRHTAFSPAPVLPAVFLIHERKFESTHDELMKYVVEAIPTLKRTSIPIVTDDEAAICSAIDKYLPNLSRIRCWNHTINAAKNWLRKHGATGSEIPVYTGHLRELFHQPSEDEYSKQLRLLESKWSRSFVDYYQHEIHPEVRLHARYVLMSVMR